jgi:hypothetical protein
LISSRIIYHQDTDCYSKLTEEEEEKAIKLEDLSSKEKEKNAKTDYYLEKDKEVYPSPYPLKSTISMNTRMNSISPALLS